MDFSQGTAKLLLVHFGFVMFTGTIFHVFSVFFITSFGDHTHLQHQDITV